MDLLLDLYFVLSISVGLVHVLVLSVAITVDVSFPFIVTVAICAQKRIVGHCRRSIDRVLEEPSVHLCFNCITR